MRLHVEALFRRDDQGSLVQVNEAGGAPAPRLFVGTTASGRQSWFRGDVPADVSDSLREVVAAAGPGVAGDDIGWAAPLERILAAHAPVESVWSGPAYRFPEPFVDVPEATDRAVAIHDDNAELLGPWLGEWLLDVPEYQPMYAVVRDGAAVSLCSSVRTTPRADEAGVETHPDFRGQGLAPIAVAAWAGAVRALGREPLYSTAWTNHASRAVAAKLGLIQFGADYHVR